jgi:hypothetical protein
MKLVSNFRDYYDYAFDGAGKTFTRTGGNVGPSKREQFLIMASAGFKVPPHGTVGEILDRWWFEENRWIRHVVAYEDPMAHCTEGKRILSHVDFQHLGSLVTGGTESWRLSQLYASAFVGHPAVRPSVSWRRLQIGRHVFWLECVGDDSWMSNFGEGSWKVIGQESGLHRIIIEPLWAVDFVLGKEMWAVDYNTAPGLRGTGVDNIMSGKEIVQAIEEVVL